jgi:trimethylamine--corrinoid protein Co-methyltransferase
MKLLSDDLIRKILDEAYKLLETKGVAMEHDALPEQLAGAGCIIDSDTKRIRMPREIVEAAVKSAPSRIELWNMDGSSCCDLSGDNVHFTPGSSAIKMLDEKTQKIRPSVLEDLHRYNKVVEQLDAIDYSSTAIVPNDVPDAIGDSIRLYSLLKSTSKAIVTGAFTIDGFNVMADMLLAVRGTKEALREKPFAIFSACPTPPLRWNEISADNTVRCAELGIPVEFIAMPLAGMVSPISLVGCVIQHAVETLSGIVISQTTRPGAPVLYGGSAGTLNMREMTAAFATVEAEMINCAYVEVGKYLGLPTQAYIGESDSKTLDAQMGFESGGGLHMAGLTGINSVSSPGMHYFGASFSLEKLVFDAQLCELTHRLAAGLEPREDLPADDLFDELLTQGSLLMSEHTLKHFRQEHCIPGPLIDRTESEEDDAVPLMQRAQAEVERHIGQYEPPDVLSADQYRDLERIMKTAAGDFKIDF